MDMLNRFFRLLERIVDAFDDYSYLLVWVLLLSAVAKVFNIRIKWGR